MLMMARTTNPGSFLQWDNGNQDRQEVQNHWEKDGHEDNEDKECPSGADNKKEDHDLDTSMLGDCGPVTASPP